MSMTTWIWRSLRLEVPGSWEMLQYSRDAESGNVAFADRYQYRLELNWKKVPGAPDFPRMLQDYRVRLRDEGGHTDLRDVRYGDWQGIEGRETTGSSARFGRYMPSLERLVEIVFLWPQQPDQALQRRVLESCDAELPDADHLQHWRAFGLDLRTHDDLELETCNIRPALAALTFTDYGKGRRSEHFERLGMVDEWLKVNLDEWLVGKTPEKAVDLAETRVTLARHEVYVRRGMMAALTFPTIGKRRNRWVAAVWRCPADGRLYHSSLMQPAADPAVSLPDSHRLCCCPAFAAAAVPSIEALFGPASPAATDDEREADDAAHRVATPALHLQEVARHG